VDTGIVKEKHLQEYQEKNPSLLRYDIPQYMEILEVFATISKKSGSDWPMRIKKGWVSPFPGCFSVLRSALTCSRASPTERDAQ
jgi:hypothetical protein